MKKYMVLTQGDDGEVSAKFFDDLDHAENHRMNAECGMGYYTEVYERSEEQGYELIY